MAVILFDIDATLITTSRAGMKAMRDAASDYFGKEVDISTMNFAGSLDPLIIAEILRLGGAPVNAENMRGFTVLYQHQLTRWLNDQSTICKALPGVQDLLSTLRVDKRFTLALLTGNYQSTGEQKLRACGIDPGWFAFGVWGGMSTSNPPTRDDLPGVAKGMMGAGEHWRAVVIGDTPHDIRCGLLHGCQTIGIATGPYSTCQLTASGAHLALDNLADAVGVHQWLVERMIEGG